MPNFFEERRTRLGLNRTQIAARIGCVAEAVRLWELERAYPSTTIASLAKAYEVAISRMATEVMALRMRIEDRRAVAAK